MDVEADAITAPQARVGAADRTSWGSVPRPAPVA